MTDYTYKTLNGLFNCKLIISVIPIFTSYRQRMVACGYTYNNHRSSLIRYIAGLHLETLIFVVVQLCSKIVIFPRVLQFVGPSPCGNIKWIKDLSVCVFLNFTHFNEGLREGYFAQIYRLDFWKRFKNIYISNFRWPILEFFYLTLISSSRVLLNTKQFKLSYTHNNFTPDNILIEIHL